MSKSDHTHFSFTGEEPPSDEEIARMIAESIEEERIQRNEERRQKTELLADDLGRPVTIAYKGTKGPVKERSIEIRKIEKRNGVVTFSGFCEMAQKPRMFKATGVLRLVDDVTGEVIGPANVATWLIALAREQAE